MNKDTTGKSKGWKFTSRTITILSVIGFLAWFISNPSFEPLIAFLPVILSVIVLFNNSRWQIDLAVSVLLVILFLGGLFLVLNQHAIEQVVFTGVNNIELWKFLVIVISIIIVLILVLLWFLRRNNRISRTLLWALIGNSDNKSVEEFFEQMLKILVSSILWSIVTSVVFVLALLIITILSLALGTEIHGTETAIVQYGVLGLVLGALLGIVVAIIRLIQSKNNDLQRDKTLTSSSGKKYINYKGLLWKSSQFGFGLPAPLCSRENCGRPVSHKKKYPPRYLASSNLEEMQEFLNKQNTYRNIYRCPVHGELTEVPNIDMDTLKQEVKFEIKR